MSCYCSLMKNYYLCIRFAQSLSGIPLYCVHTKLIINIKLTEKWNYLK